MQKTGQETQPETAYTPYPGLAEEDDHGEEHPLPRGALLITLGYLALLTALWLHVYLQLLMSGGIPQ
jgi:hypothetical protein